MYVPCSLPRAPPRPRHAGKSQHSLTKVVELLRLIASILTCHLRYLITEVSPWHRVIHIRGRNISERWGTWIGKAMVGRPFGFRQSGECLALRFRGRDGQRCLNLAGIVLSCLRIKASAADLVGERYCV